MITGIVALLIVAAVAAIAFWPKAKSTPVTPPAPVVPPLGLFDPQRMPTTTFNIDAAIKNGAEVTEHATPWSNTRVVRQPLARNTHIDVGICNERRTRFDRDEILFSIECK